MSKSEQTFNNIISWGAVNPNEFPHRNIPKPKSTCSCAEYYSHGKKANCSCSGGWNGYESGHGNAFCKDGWWGENYK